MIEGKRWLCVLVLALTGLALLPAAGSAAGPGEISGKVTDASSGLGIGGVEVCAIEPELLYLECVYTGVTGEYLITELPVGEYIVEFWAEELGYSIQFYNGRSSGLLADEIPVSGLVTGINAILSKPTPPPPPVIPAPAPIVLPPPPVVAPKPALKCRKGFKKVKRQGKTICVKKQGKKRRKKQSR